MHEALGALLGQRRVDVPMWASFWDALGSGALDRGEPIALLASLASNLTDHETVADLVRSLHLRWPGATPSFPGAVNIVGTGGGPPTFNISTAAALVAAAMGVPIIKTGSRAYTSSCGSLDLLDHLGVPLTKSYDETGEMLDRHGIAFAGYFVYPAELTMLARRVAPLPMRMFGPALNTLGPFLPALPGTAQLTGVSSPSVLPLARYLAGALDDRSIWLCSNDIGADELIGFTDNVIELGDGTTRLPVGPDQLGRPAGTLEDLRPFTEPARPSGGESGKDGIVAHFLDVVSGRGSEIATETVALNAAALTIIAGHNRDWTAAMSSARQAMRSGAVVELLTKVGDQRRRGSLLSTTVGS
jgi:anthranilate phosphoribosyltransferase